MQVDVRSLDNEVVGTAELDDRIFATEVREHLLHEVVVMQLACRRSGSASTKRRHEVSGSDVKPWRQKGTGRARAGTRTSPLWRGGGIIFGPKPRSFAYRVPKKVRRGALCSALSLKLRQGQLVLVDKLEVAEPKTREVAGFLRRLGLSGKVLLLVEEASEVLGRAARNIPQVKLLPVRGLNVYDLLAYDTVVSTPQALERVQERLTAS